MLTRASVYCVEQLKREASSPYIGDSSIEPGLLFVVDFIGHLVIIVGD